MDAAELGSAIWLSARVATAATCLSAVVALPLAWALARVRFFGKSWIEALLIVPLVLPPTVVGYLLILNLGARGWLGSWLYALFGYRMIFRIEAAIVAAAVVCFPLVYLPAKAAFSSVEREMEEVARLMGANTVQIAWHVSLPLARRGIASGLLLAFARALGEFGATVMVLGISPGRQTLPLLVYADYVSGRFEQALPAVVTLSAVCLIVIFIYNRSPLGRQQQ